MSDRYESIDAEIDATWTRATRACGLGTLGLLVSAISLGCLAAIAGEEEAHIRLRSIFGLPLTVVMVGAGFGGIVSLGWGILMRNSLRSTGAHKPKHGGSGP